MAAATAMFNRFVEYFRSKKFPSPEDILRTSEDDLRNIGILKARITCLKYLLTKIINKEIHPIALEILVMNKSLKNLRR